MDIKELSTEELISLAQEINSELRERREKMNSAIIIKYDDNTDLLDTDLSTRALNVLYRRAEIKTVGDLKSKFNKTSLIRYSNVGKKTIEEIELFLSENV